MLPRLDLPGGRTQRRHSSTCCTRAALLVGLLVTLGTTLPAPVTAHWTVNGVNYTVYNATDMSNLILTVMMPRDEIADGVTTADVTTADPDAQSATELCGELHDTKWPPVESPEAPERYLTVGAPQTLWGPAASRGMHACRAMLMIGRGVWAAGGIPSHDVDGGGQSVGVRFLVADFAHVNGYARGSTEGERAEEATRRLISLGAAAILAPFGDDATRLTTLTAQRVGSSSASAKVPVVAWAAPSDHLYRCPTNDTHPGRNLTGLALEFPPCVSPGRRRFEGLFSVNTPASLVLRDALDTVPALGGSGTSPRGGIAIVEEARSANSALMAARAAERAAALGYSPITRWTFDGVVPAFSSWYQAATRLVESFRDNATSLSTGLPPEVVVLAGEDRERCLELARAFGRVRWLPTSAVILEPCGAAADARDALMEDGRWFFGTGRWDRRMGGSAFVESAPTGAEIGVGSLGSVPVGMFRTGGDGWKWAGERPNATAEATAPEVYAAAYGEIFGGAPEDGDAAATAAVYYLTAAASRVNFTALTTQTAIADALTAALTAVHVTSFYGELRADGYGVNGLRGTAVYQTGGSGERVLVGAPRGSSNVAAPRHPLPAFGAQSRRAPCPAGTFVEGANRFCTAVERATDVSRVAAAYLGVWCDTTCEPCAPGSFSVGVGSYRCEACPDNAVQPNASSTSCDVCPRGTSREKSGTACVTCADGSFRASAEEPTGKCQPCELGTFKPAGSDPSTGCLPCAADAYAATRGATSCTPCPAGMRRVVNVTDAATLPGRTRDACKCSIRGKFLDTRSYTCEDCPSGAVCEVAGSTLRFLTPSPGYYRFHDNTAKFYPCPDARACHGGGKRDEITQTMAAAGQQTHGDALCAPHSTGPLCMECDEGYFRRFVDFKGFDGGEACGKCGRDPVPHIVAALAMLAAALFLLVALWPGVWGRWRLNGWWRVALVQTWLTVQCVSRFSAVQNVDYPVPFNFFVNVFHLVSLDISTIFPSVTCYFPSAKYWMLLVVITAAPLAVAAVVLLRVQILRMQLFARRLNPRTRHFNVLFQNLMAERERLFGVVLTSIVLFHNPICSAAYQYFRCDPHNLSSTVPRYEVSEGVGASRGVREKYMVVDYSTTCTSEFYRVFTVFPATVLVTYIAVFPLAMLWIMRQRWRSHTPGDGPTWVLTSHCRPGARWYELTAMMFRLVVSGALEPLVSHKGLHLSIVVCFTVAFMFFTREVMPCVNHGHNAVINACHLVLVAAVFSAAIHEPETRSDVVARLFSSVAAAMVIAYPFMSFAHYWIEDVNAVVDKIRAKLPFDPRRLSRAFAGLNKRELTLATLETASDILRRHAEAEAEYDDGMVGKGLNGARTRANRRKRGAGGLDSVEWKYFEKHLMPLHRVWSSAARASPLLLSHAPGARARAGRDAAAVGKELTLKQFEQVFSQAFGPIWDFADVRENAFRLFHSNAPRKSKVMKLTLPVTKVDGIAMKLLELVCGNQRMTIPWFTELKLLAHDLRDTCWTRAEDLVRLHCDPRTAKMGRKLQWYREFDKTRDGRPAQELLDLKETRRWLDAIGRKPALLKRLDGQALPEVLRSVAEEMHEEFVAALRQLMPNAKTFPDPPAPPAPRPKDDSAKTSEDGDTSAVPNALPSRSSPGMEGEVVAGLRDMFKPRTSTGGVVPVGEDDEILYGFEAPEGPDAWSTRVSLKCSKEDAIDSSAMIREKSARYREDNAAEMSPLTTYSSFIVDCLRATIVCADSETMVHVCEAITREKSPFQEVKFRNNLGNLRKPYNLVFNVVFKPLFMPALMVEISLVHHDVHQLVQMADTFERISTALDVEATCPNPAPTCESIREANAGGRDEVTGAKAVVCGFEPWSGRAVRHSLRFAGGAGGAEADTTAVEERRYDDAALERFINAPDRSMIPIPGGNDSVSAYVSATSRIGHGVSHLADPKALAAAAAKDVQENTLPAGQGRRDPKVAAAAEAARAALLEDSDSDYSPAYDRVKPDVSMFEHPAAGQGPIRDVSQLGAKDVKALVPPALNFPKFGQDAMEVTNFDSSDSDEDPGSPELRRQLPPAPIRKIDKMWPSSGTGT